MNDASTGIGHPRLGTACAGDGDQHDVVAMPEPLGRREAVAIETRHMHIA
jgi:hypothetical protein